MRCKTMWKFVPQAGKTGNECVEVISDPGLRLFHWKRADGGPCVPCRNLGEGNKAQKEQRVQDQKGGGKR